MQFREKLAVYHLCDETWALLLAKELSIRCTLSLDVLIRVADVVKRRVSPKQAITPISIFLLLGVVLQFVVDLACFWLVSFGVETFHGA